MWIHFESEGERVFMDAMEGFEETYPVFLKEMQLDELWRMYREGDHDAVMREWKKMRDEQANNGNE